MATATSKATIKIDKISSSGGPDVKSSGSIALKKKVNDVTLTVAFTDATLQDYNNLTDIVVTAEKSLGSALVVAGCMMLTPHTAPQAASRAMWSTMLASVPPR